MVSGEPAPASSRTLAGTRHPLPPVFAQNLPSRDFKGGLYVCWFGSYEKKPPARGAFERGICQVKWVGLGIPSGAKSPIGKGAGTDGLKPVPFKARSFQPVSWRSGDGLGDDLDIDVAGAARDVDGAEGEGFAEGHDGGSFESRLVDDGLLGKWTGAVAIFA